jgi:hypothetical protein
VERGEQGSGWIGELQYFNLFFRPIYKPVNMKCPKGYICLVDRWGSPLLITVTITLIAIGLVYIFQNEIRPLIFRNAQHTHHAQPVYQTATHQQNMPQPPPPPTNISVDLRGPISVKPEYGDDIGNNPYIPPLKPHQHGLPINIRTRGGMRNFAQLGVLTGTKDGQQVVLPLYGRPTYGGSDYYEYYTASDGFQSFKMPIINQGKDCTNEHGCKEIFDKDTIAVKGYTDDFRVDLYQNQMPRYIPYL